MQQRIEYTETGFDAELRRVVMDEIEYSHGGWKIILKAVILLGFHLALYILPFVIEIPLWGFVPLAIVQGVLMSGIGMGIMHDANHGTFSQKRKVNDFVSKVLYLVGGDVSNWRMQHNVIHHTFTNVVEHDDDINGHGILRLSPKQEWNKKYRGQEYYAFAIYSLMTLFWITSKDFTQAKRYHTEARPGYKTKEEYQKHFWNLILSKSLYWFVWVVVTMLFWKTPWWMVLVFFLGMHLSASLLLGLVFQPAHVSERACYLEEAKFTSRLKHQIATSCNFATTNKVITWLFGGLNFQIEHHLFPNVSHVHYPKISKVVRTYCKQKGIMYKDLGTWISAIWGHVKFLRELGRTQEV